MPELGVNIDHVATLRQARRTYEPDPVWAAAAAELGGADGITIHLREDRRHILDRDLELLRQTVSAELKTLAAAAKQIRDSGLALHAGHGLNYHNVQPIAKIECMHELNIGHAIIARSVFVGLQTAVHEMKDLIS